MLKGCHYSFDVARNVQSFLKAVDKSSSARWRILTGFVSPILSHGNKVETDIAFNISIYLYRQLAIDIACSMSIAIRNTVHDDRLSVARSGNVAEQINRVHGEKSLECHIDNGINNRERQRRGKCEQTRVEWVMGSRQGEVVEETGLADDQDRSKIQKTWFLLIKIRTHQQANHVKCNSFLNAFHLSMPVSMSSYYTFKERYALGGITITLPRT